MVLIAIALIVAVIWGTIAHLIFRPKITLMESLAQAGIATVVAALVVVCIYYKDMGDTAVINGQITDKKQVRVSCSHSYECNCYYTTSCSGSGTSRSCSTTKHCSTCYEHSNDWDWDVFSTVGNFSIDRIDRQGKREPPRWTLVQIGEPAANTVSYLNYVKAAPQSLFAMNQLEDDKVKFAGMFPQYPQIYDYYRINRIMQIGVQYPQAQKLNDNLNMALRSMGAAKQVNINVIFVKTTDTQYRYALERAWLGGKKNDVTVMIGMDSTGAFSWVDTMTFGKNAGNELTAVVMRDRIKALAAAQQFGNADLLSNEIVATINKEFHRKEMKDYEYLKDDYSPSQTAIIWFIIIQMVVLVGTTIFFYHFELERGAFASSGYGRYVPTYSIHRRNTVVKNQYSKYRK